MQPHPRGNFWNNRIIERISRTATSLKDKRRTNRTHPDLLQAQQLVIFLLFIASTTHIQAVLIAPQPVIIKHRSRSSFGSPFTSTTHHYGLFWSMHSQLILASLIIHAVATIRLGELLSSYIFLIHQYNMLRVLYGFTIMPL